MSRICRTCLLKTNLTFKTSQSLGDFGNGSVRISQVMKFIVPELYLGLSTNPEICFACKESLKAAYQFRRKCLNTEHVIGNYLKGVRCTGQSIELEDVLEYAEKNNIQTANQEAKSKQNDKDTDINNLCDRSESKNNPQVTDVHQSVPNPTIQGNVLNFSNYQNLFISNKINLLDVKNLSQTNPTTTRAFIVKPAIATSQKNSTWEIGNFQNKDNSDKFCQISSVFSLNDPPAITNENNSDSTNLNTTNTEQNPTQNSVKIKEEPLDPEATDPQIGVNSITPDEDTLDASETARYENSYSPGLQRLFDNIPDVHNPDQYVDIPDFVTINNFGLKDLEELRLQQGTVQTVPEVDNNPLSAPLASVEPTQNETPADETKPDKTLLKLAPKAAEMILLNGKRIVKCDIKNVYSVHNKHVATISGKQLIVRKVQEKNTVRKRNRKRIRIVPVADQPADKKLKFDPNSLFGIALPKLDEKDIVVLFTNYTTDGVYINDHDYLMSPYKRNKVLVEENSEWHCMCYICNTRHQVYEHVKHMNTHGTFCTVCNSDLGTSYMLNIHYRSHKKPCRYCTQVLPYNQVKAHEEKHIAEENEILEDSERKGVAVKRRRKLTKDEKPVYFALPRPDANEARKGNASTSDERVQTVIPEDKPESETGGKEDLNGSKRRVKVRRTSERDVQEATESPRTLRTRVRKRYAESDDEQCSKTETLSSSKGTQSDLTKEEK